MSELLGPLIDKPLKTRRKWRGSLSFCLYALYVLGVSAVMLFCNSLASFVLYSTIPRSQEGAMVDAVSQLFFYVMPILLTFLQWYLIDRLMRVLNH